MIYFAIFGYEELQGTKGTPALNQYVVEALLINMTS